MKWYTRLAAVFAGGLAIALVASPARAQKETDLAKQTQNPVADLVSIPIQFNFYSGGDSTLPSYSLTNLQPVMPLPINDKWNVIVRTIVPFVSMPAGGVNRAYGIGDIQEQIFFTPKKPSSLIWGIGPQASLPTATNSVVASGQTALGVTGVVLEMTGPWVIGALANNVWRIMGDDPPGGGINQFLVQPFINYNLKRGWALSTSPTITADWNAPSGEQWTVPIGMGLSKVDRIGSRPVSLALQYYHLAERPAGTPDTIWRFVVSFLYPKGKPGAEEPKPAGEAKPAE